MPIDFGLIGYPLSHSFSPAYFKEKFEREGIVNQSYQLFPLPEFNREVFRNLLLSHPNLRGLNVTLPYKRDIIPLLDKIDATAKEIGAVNTIRIDRKSDETIATQGFNTDVEGIRVSLRQLLDGEPMPEKALILGSGGSAQSVAWVLRKLNIPFATVSRTKTENGYLHWNQVRPQEYPLIINCTPVGMYPHVEEFPRLNYAEIGEIHLVFDLIYRPDPSLFLKKCAENGAKVLSGRLMLITQAEFSYKIWTGVL